ncbi:hypothetical protein ZOSMA_76G00070 [Zostera marina]|uniref:Pentatricopeptide repeat-containing protein n=1 Tax=Zostera marina TaxID=29655 RepID=A0A0K9NQS8_ZOSMR|nr:hypothetical protein ZOSMA_76G00070 [Zostera marina]
MFIGKSIRRLYSITASTITTDGYWENELLTRLCCSKLYKEAMESFFSFKSQRPYVPIFSRTYRHLFRAASNLKSPLLSRQIHDHLSLSGIDVDRDVILQNHILHAYGRCGLVEDAEQLFDGMVERNTVSWTEMIAAYANNLREHDAIEMYVSMRRLGFGPDEFTIGSVMGACSRMGAFGREIHGDVVKLDCGSKILVQNSLVTMYTKSDCVDDAWSVFRRMRERNVVSWGAMISCFANQSVGSEAVWCLREMLRSEQGRPNEIIFEAIFRGCADFCFSGLESGEQVHALFSKSGVGGSGMAGCSLINMYARFGKLDCSKKGFYNIQVPDLVAWNLIIRIFAKARTHAHTDTLMSLFSEMRRTSADIHPNGITFCYLLGGLKKPTQSCMRQGQQLHSLIVKTGFIDDMAVCNSLLTMYVCVSCSDDDVSVSATHARFLFEEMGRKKKRDLVSFNVFLRGCLHHDHPREVLKLVKKLMIGCGCRPDEITLNIMFRACGRLLSLQTCSHLHAYSFKLGFESDVVVANIILYTYAKCGNLQDARLLAKIMGNLVDVVSWTSLICGYAQYGLGREVIQLFNEMQTCVGPTPIKPNEVTILGLLSACNRAGLVSEGCTHFQVMETEYGITPTREHFSCIIDMLSRAGHLKQANTLVHNMPFEADIVVWKSLLSGCCVHGNFEMAQEAASYIFNLQPANTMACASLCNMYALDENWKQEVSRLRRNRRMTMNAGFNKFKFSGKSWVDVKGEVHDFVKQDTTHPYTKQIYALLDALQRHHMNEK